MNFPRTRLILVRFYVISLLFILTVGTFWSANRAIHSTHQSVQTNAVLTQVNQHVISGKILTVNSYHSYHHCQTSQNICAIFCMMHCMNALPTSIPAYSVTTQADSLYSVLSVRITNPDLSPMTPPPKNT